MLSENELMQIKGGSLSGPVINAFIEIYNKIFDLGRSFGTLIKRVVKKKYC